MVADIKDDSAELRYKMGRELFVVSIARSEIGIVND